MALDIIWKERSMQQEIERLKRKYIFSASAIVIAVIWGMLLVMNLLIQMLFRANSSNADAMILQAAKSYDYQTETLLLSEMEQNVDGDYLIPRSIHSVDSITLSGTIRSDSDSESWYCGGGGLMYLEETANQQELVYREYTFNFTVLPNIPLYLFRNPHFLRFQFLQLTL